MSDPPVSNGGDAPAPMLLEGACGCGAPAPLPVVSAGGAASSESTPSVGVENADRTTPEARPISRTEPGDLATQSRFDEMLANQERLYKGVDYLGTGGLYEQPVEEAEELYDPGASEVSEGVEECAHVNLDDPIHEYGTGEAAAFRRAVFEHSIPMMGASLPKLPWETGIYGERSLGTCRTRSSCP